MENSNDCDSNVETEKQSCNTQLCPIDGNWGMWGEWFEYGPPGLQRRTRSCNSPPPSFDGENCFGERFEYKNGNSNLSNEDFNYWMNAFASGTDSSVDSS